MKIPAVRVSTQRDVGEIVSLYPLAFPDEDLVPLVHALLNESSAALSLVALLEKQIAGHAVFTQCAIEGRDTRVALLGPIAVAPAFQRRGVGSALIRAGFKILADAGVGHVCVLGDPGYYGRLGFAPDSAIDPPIPLPPAYEGAWQSRTLGEVAASPVSGKLLVPPPWRQRSLWVP